MRFETLGQSDNVRALANYLQVKYSEAENLIDEGVYEVLDEYAIMEKARDGIIQTLWAFRYEFLSDNCPIIAKINKDAWENMVNSLGESINDAIYDMIEATSDFWVFVDEAIAADGLGHFTNSYDGTVIESDTECTCSLDASYYIIKVG